MSRGVVIQWLASDYVRGLVHSFAGEPADSTPCARAVLMFSGHGLVSGMCEVLLPCHMLPGTCN